MNRGQKDLKVCCVLPRTISSDDVILQRAKLSEGPYDVSSACVAGGMNTAQSVPSADGQSNLT